MSEHIHLSPANAVPVPSDFCPSCGIAWVEHLGIIGTCAKLQKAEELAETYANALAWICTRPETGLGACQMREKALQTLA